MGFSVPIAHPPVTRTFIQFPNEAFTSMPSTSKSESIATFRAYRHHLKEDDAALHSDSESEEEGFHNGFLETPKFDEEVFDTFLNDPTGGDESLPVFDGDFGDGSQSTCASVEDIPVRRTFIDFPNGLSMDNRLCKSETLSHFLRRQPSSQVHNDSDADHMQPNRLVDVNGEQADGEIAIEILICLPSKGSAEHCTGECQPCGFFHNEKVGCKEGYNCRFCHLCGPEERKKRRVQKAERMRLQRQKASPDV
jgi:hypothetical protein